MPEGTNWTDRLRSSPRDDTPAAPRRSTTSQPVGQKRKPTSRPAFTRTLHLKSTLIAATRHMYSFAERTVPLLLPFLRRHIRLTLTAAAVLLAMIGGISILHARSSSTINANTAAAKTTGPVRATPSYSTIAPTGKKIDDLGGWYRVSPPGSDPVYAYADHLGAVRIDVSQQPLPASMKSNTAEHIAELAQNFGASEKLKISGITAYIGTSAKGPQSVIYTKNDLLILIRSDDKLTTDQWTQYVSKLQ